VKGFLSILLLLFQASPDRVVGLLELPELFSLEPCQPFDAKPLIVYSEPAGTAARIGVLNVRNPWKPDDGCPALTVRLARNSRDETFPTEEVDYEQPAAIVFERRENWFRIKLQFGSGWVEREADDLFAPYPALLDDALTYIPQAWDGKLFQAADPSAAAVEIPAAWRVFTRDILPVKVLDDALIGGESWLHIRIDVDAGCGTLPAELPSFEGWLPAYRQSGDTAVWFHSRGC
jgi:hypothetical protein